MIRCLNNDYGEFNETQKIGPAKWPHFDLIFIHQGQVQIKLLESDDISLHAGQAVLIYPDTPFEGYSVTPVSRASVHHFSISPGERNPPAAMKSFAKMRQGFETFLCQPAASVERDITRITLLAYEPPSPLIQDMQASVMRLILAQLSIANSEKYPASFRETKFQPLMAWLSENLDKNITMEDMAAQTGFSASHFRAIFRTEVGTSPGNYFLNMRMNEAARLLRETLLPIKEIARRVGYDELPHFYRAFKSLCNKTPKIYRREHATSG